MAQTRREFLRCGAGLGGLLLAGSATPDPAPRAAALRSALAFFAARQSPDGAWRSERYPAFRAGDALTPVVLWALQSTARVHGAEEVSARGLRWLERLTDARSERPESWPGCSYPLFTASYSAQVLAQAGDLRRAARWGDLIENLRATPALGWPADHPGCGAWSDAAVPPRYVAPVPDMLAPNISASTLAVQALAAIGRRSGALTGRPFLERCQNFAAEAVNGFDDGGFFFALDDPIRNKAGTAGRDLSGRERFRSYGSATCDGFLALRACGLDRNHPRILAAGEWVRRHRASIAHAAVWPAGRAAWQEALLFYHAQALAVVLADLAPALDWASGLRRNLTRDLFARQRRDGAWQGTSPESCEDEPLLASAFAVRALSA